MVSSGVPVDIDCITEFNAMKLNKKDIKYIIYGLNETLEKVQIIEIGDSSKSYDDMISKFPSDDCRFAVINFDFEIEDGKRSKCLFVSWAPSKAKPKSKMVYTASKSDLKKQLEGCSIELNADCQGEVTYENALERCMKFC